MSCKYKYNGKEYTESELLQLLSEDKDLIKQYAPKGELLRGSIELEDKNVFDKKISRLKEAMDVEVVIDDSINSSRVLGKNDKRVKAAGKPVILINSNQLFRETAIHEFGHIFLDSFPKGINNPRIQKAYNQLAGTELEAEVKAKYPDLSPDMLVKEVIATALGREGADIWDNQDDRSRWQVFTEWFQSFINRLFGIPKNEVTNMVKEMLGGQELNRDLMDGLSMNNQELRVREASSAGISKTASLERVYQELIARVTNAYNEYKPTTKEEKRRERNRSLEGPTRFEAITGLKEQLEKFDSIDQQLGLSKYVDWVDSELDVLRSTFEKRKATGKLSNDNIINSIRWDQAFSMIEDIQNLSNSLHKEGLLTDEDKDYYNNILKKIQGKRSELQSELLQAGRESYARFMSENNNEVKEGYALGYAKDFDDLDLASSGQTKEEYVRAQLIANEDAIKEEAYKEALFKAEESLSDISAISAKFFTEKNAKSEDIQVLSKVVDAADLEIAEFANDEASQFSKNNYAYKQNLSDNITQAKKYEKMLTQSESGTYYFNSQYKPEFNEKRMEYINSIGDKVINEEKYAGIEIDKNMYYTIDGKRTKLFIPGFKNLIYKEGSMHVEYLLGGETHSITKEEAIARSEYDVWLKENTEKVQIGNKLQWVPKQSWKNEAYDKLTPQEKEQLNWFKDKIKIADNMTGGAKSLISRSHNQEWIRLPGVLKSDVQRIAEGNIKNYFSHKLKEITKVQADDFETAQGDKRSRSDIIKVYADISNKERQRVPIPFRSKLKSNDQSLDLHTIVLMNTVAAKEYQEKKKLESTFLIVLEVMKNRKVQDTAGPRRLKKIHAMSEEDAEIALYKNPKDGLYNDVKKAMDLMENRIYNIKNKDAGEIAGVNIQQATRSWLKYSGTVALLGNIANSIVNYNMGNVSNFIEAMGGEHFTVKDLAIAKKKYWKDAKGIIGDMGSNVNTSRTNLFMNIFNVAGGKEYLDNRFEEGTRFQTLMKLNNLRPIAKSGEHMMQSQVMYAVMNNIKVMNKDGKFIDKDGNVVPKNKAASLDEMIYFAKGIDGKGQVEMRLDEKVAATSFTLTGGRDQILLETRNLIKNKILELHGNYDQDIQAAAQREFWGKLLFFLRKWTLPGIQRRYRGFGSALKATEDLTEADRFYSQDVKANREGYYVTGIRFFAKVLIPAIKELNLNLIKQGNQKLSAMEKANLKKLATELMLIAGTYMAYLALDDDEDPEKNLYSKYIMRRQFSELAFFSSPIEAFKIASTPTASVGTFKRILQVFTQLMDPYEEYEQGPNKGRLKLTVKALKAFPVTSQTEKNISDSLKFLTQMSF